MVQLWANLAGPKYVYDGSSALNRIAAPSHKVTTKATVNGRSYAQAGATTMEVEQDYVLPPFDPEEPVRFYKTLVHELTHCMNYIDPDLTEAIIQWVESKAPNPGDRQKLSLLTGDPGYADTEIAVPGDFSKPYVGKEYKWSGFPRGYAFQEVTSMGIQELLYEQDFIKFLQEYPDHTLITLGAMSRK